MNRPPATLALAAVAAISAITNLTISLQFLGVLDWGSEDLDFWGGKWAGVFLFGLAGAIGVLVVYGWLTLKPWALTFTILMAFLSFSIPFMAVIAGTETLSTALVPMTIDILIIYLAMRKDVREAVKINPHCLTFSLCGGEPLLVDRAGDWRRVTDTFTARFDHHN